MEKRLFIVIFASMLILFNSVKSEANQSALQVFNKFYEMALKYDYPQIKKLISEQSNVDIKEYCDYITKNGKIKDFFSTFLSTKVKDKNNAIVLGIFLYEKDMSIKNKLRKSGFNIETAITFNNDTKKIDGIVISLPNSKAPIYCFENQWFMDLVSRDNKSGKEIEFAIMPFFLIKENGIWKIDARGIPERLKKEKG